MTHHAPAETTTTTGGGGGGGGTTVTKKFDADLTQYVSVELTMKQGTVKTFTLDGTATHKITIGAVTENTVTLTITSQPVNITLSIGQTRKADLNHDGSDDISIQLQSISQGAATIVITALPQPTVLPAPEVISPVIEKGKQAPLFDVKITIPDKYKTVFPGEDILAEITLINVGATGKVDVEITYTLTNPQGLVIENHTDTRAVETTTGLTKIFTTPPDAQQGQYTLTTQLKYQQYTATTTATITIKKRIPYLPATIQKHWKETLLTIGIIIAILLSITLFRRLRKKEEKLEKEVKKLKKKK